MDPSNGQHQEISSHTMENMLVCQKPGQDRKPRPQPDQALKCPRCDSTNTKFCYYNNYSLSQPRYFCKSCRRYWTKGGTLRNVPVGGGCRKNKRSCSSKRAQDQPLIQNASALNGLPSLSYDSNDLSLAFARLQKQSGGHLVYDHDQDLSMFGNHIGDHVLGCSGISSSVSAPFLDAIRSSFVDSQSKLFQNLYYANENGNITDMESNPGCVSQGEMGMPYEDMINGGTTQAVTVTTMKQELNHLREDNENRILWGFPWQQLNGGNVMMGGGGGNDLEAGRESWNGLNATWHGLLNSALM